jgi:CelD/BcsL family acetyltransferase involved in cellulose biosynthesis
MRVTLLRGRELSADLQRAWSRLQQEHPSLDSPYLSPEFTAAVAAVRDDVRIALLEKDHRIEGFFPFQTGPEGEGVPLADGLSDCQGVVAGKRMEWDAPRLIRDCGLRSWRFTHLLADQRPFLTFQQSTFAAAHIDLSSGYAAFLRKKRELGSRLVEKVQRAERMLEREVGPVHFEVDSDDRAVLRMLMRWKSDQYRRTGIYDRFAIAWIVELLERLWRTRAPGFSGVLSALSVRGEVAAVHLGIRSHRVWHWWFPAYDCRLARYSPGHILLLRCAEAAESLRLQRIDLGNLGASQYKQRFMTGFRLLARGVVTASA